MSRSRLKSDIKWVLDYQGASPPSELRGSLRGRDDDDDDDELPAEERDPDELEAPLLEPGALLEQLSGQRDDDDDGQPGVQVVRALGDEVISMELLLPGEAVTALPRFGLEVETEPDGSCRVRGGRPGLSAQRITAEGAVEEVPAEGLDLLVSRPERFVARIDDELLMLRPRGRPGSARTRGARWMAWLLVASIGALVAASIIATALWLSARLGRATL